MGRIINILFYLSLLSVVVHSHKCQISKCSNIGVPIKFPFRSVDDDQPTICGYPGFDLRCSSKGIPILNLPNSGDFLVRDINYLTQQIEVYDPSNCLPQRLLNLTLSSSSSSSVFNALDYQSYTFLRCPREVVKPWYSIIECLSDSTSAVLATSSVAVVKATRNMCDIMYSNLRIPVAWPYEDVFTSEFSADLRLKWDFPYCKPCESKGNMCGFQSDEKGIITCYNPSKEGRSRKWWPLIAIVIILPTVLVGLLYSWRLLRRMEPVSGSQQAGSTAQNINPAADALRPNTATTDTRKYKYSKIVLAQSLGPLPGSSHVTCSICLVDYRPNEVLGCLHGCEHCFHVKCIDEWFRTKCTCPICRATPCIAGNPLLVDGGS